MTDPFAILGVPRGATQDEIKAAFRKLAIKYHPDKNPGDTAAEERFKEINSAYQTLSNPQRQQQEPPPGYGRGPNHFEFNFGPGGFTFEDIFGSFHAAQRPRRNADINAQVSIGLEQAMAGCEAKIEVPTRNGIRHAAITIPAGVDTGTRLKLSGHGDTAVPGVPPGDLLVTIIVGRHPLFERMNEHLLAKQTITVFQAMLGAQIEVPLLGGGTQRINIPAGIQPGQSVCVSGYGMPLLQRADVRGDLIVKIEVVIPPLNDQQQDLIRQASSL